MSAFFFWEIILYIYGCLMNSFVGPDMVYEPYGYEVPAEDYVLEVNESDKPAMVEARLETEETGYFISNMYGIDALSSDVVGMVGVPVLVESYNGAALEEVPTLVFVYDEEELTCGEEDLGILYYDEANGWYETLENIEVDTAADEIRVPVDRLGTYILEDMETWISVWNGTYEYEEPLQPECHWHNEFDYRDIEKLADTSLYDGSGEYHITTVEQLAGLVKLVNEGESFEGCNFYLDADLDLKGYRWVPIGWYYPADNGYLWQDYPFCGKFYGNGHAIYNMRIDAPDQSDLGMFGRTLSGFEIHDFSLIDCDIEGKYYVGGILGDNINAGDDFDMTNCFVSGSVRGQLKVGALVGSSAYLQIKDCSAVMEEGCTMELVGDLRGGNMENCTITDETAVER